MTSFRSNPARELGKRTVDCSLDPLGLIFASLIILAWAGMLAWLLKQQHAWNSPWTWIGLLGLTQLYTGLFITAHDAMHGTVSRSRRLNDFFGRLCATLFLFNSYSKLRPKHFLHHKHAATHGDPDFHKGDARFFPWYLSFLREYVTLTQVLMVAVMFNVLKIWFPDANLILAFVVAPLLSTVQLFTFGTYLPHRGEHAEDDPHRARSAARNHVAAFLACYFFGYHHEHHASPGTPWWRLWKLR